ncbi:MAG TPA: phosphoribosylanthranilate isomerase [Anaerolineae bacterium]|nr:phosphoribosylanthranilate isomerase [Anaerolineae bacterium]
MVKVKICGITNEEDARISVEAGADLLGFIFYPPSPRYVTPARAREILSALGIEREKICAVGIFVNESSDHLRAVMEDAELDFAQLHGKEPPEVVQAFAGRAYKSLQAKDLDVAHSLMAHYRHAVNGNTPAFIADAPPAQLPGGNGNVADWTVAREIARAFPILLAGGLNLENVRKAIETVQPWGVDVSSGVERVPGFKDHAQVREFIARAKGSGK